MTANKRLDAVRAQKRIQQMQEAQTQEAQTQPAEATAENAKKITIATHDGVFHADDVVACVLIAMFIQETFIGIDAGVPVVVRTRDEAIINEADFVVDVGMKYDPTKRRFDHHQWRAGAGFAARPDGQGRYAAAGLVWKHVGIRLVKRALRVMADVPGADALLHDMKHDTLAIGAVCMRVDKSLIAEIDAADLGEKTAGASASISSTIAKMNPLPCLGDADAHLRHKLFTQAMGFASRVLLSHVAAAIDAEVAVQHVRHALGELYERTTAARITPLVLVLDRFVPFLEEVDRLSRVDDAPWSTVAARIELVVFPGTDGKWMCQCVPPVGDRFGKRLITRAVSDCAATPGLPVEWATLQGADLAAVCGVHDAVFCHANRFICGAVSRAGALEMARKALLAAGYSQEVVA